MLSTRYLVSIARYACVAAILFSLLASTAWGQAEADPRISTLTSQLKQGDSFVRWRAGKALLKIGSYSKAAVPALIEALKIEEGEISGRARDALVKIGPDAVPNLIEELKYRDSLARSKAVEALAAIGPPAGPALIEALKDGDRDVRLGALEAVSQISPKPEGAFPILIELMKDPDPAIRSAAAQNITCCGAKAATAYLALIEALKDQDRNVRATAAFKFCGVRLAPDHPAVQPMLDLLFETLKDPDASVRSGAAEVLAYLGSTVKLALDAAIKASKDPDAKVRSRAALALGKIGPAADSVLTALLDALRDSDKTVRSNAASALKSAPARAAIYPLIVALQDSEPSVRRSAAYSLARPDAGFAVPRLIQLMSDRDAEVRNAADRALEAIGHNAGQALVNASKAKDADIRIRAAMILERVDPKDALAAHIEALKDEDGAVRSAAASSLGRLSERPEAKTIASELIEALKDHDASVRSSAARSLGRFTYNAAVKPALIELLKDPDNRVRYAAAEILSVNAEPKLVVPIFIAALKDQDPQVRIGAASALRFLGPEAKAATPALLELLDDRSLDVCKAAIDALGNFGGEDRAVIPALINLLKHRDRDIRDAATQALASIGTPAVPLLFKALMGQDSALRIRSYYALLAAAGVSEWVGALKSRDKDLRSLVFEAIEDIRVDPTSGVQAPDLLFDHSRKYLLHTVRIPCTYEGDGRAIFVSDLDTGESFPILASSGGLSASVFIESGGKYYLVIDESGGEADCSTGSFWLYDVDAKRFVIHAEGGIGDTERGVFPLIYCEDDKATRVGTVTMKNLLNREPPLRLLPRPMQGLTLRKNTKAVDDCNQIVIIRNAGRRVLVTGKREDGSYEIYYRGAIATVPKGSLKTTK